MRSNATLILLLASLLMLSACTLPPASCQRLPAKPTFPTFSEDMQDKMESTLTGSEITAPSVPTSKKPTAMLPVLSTTFGHHAVNNR